MKRKFFTFLTNNTVTLITFGALFLIYMVFILSGISCPIKFLTGISCAGCGMTRACISALKLDFATAFYYHPLWISLPFTAFFLIYFKLKNNNKAFDTTLLIFSLAMIGVYLYRMIFLDGNIVVFKPADSFVYKFISSIFSF